VVPVSEAMAEMIGNLRKIAMLLLTQVLILLFGDLCVGFRGITLLIAFHFFVMFDVFLLRYQRERLLSSAGFRYCCGWMSFPVFLLALLWCGCFHIEQ
jgi:hypothetical protein